MENIFADMLFFCKASETSEVTWGDTAGVP